MDINDDQYNIIFKTESSMKLLKENSYEKNIQKTKFEIIKKISSNKNPFKDKLTSFQEFLLLNKENSNLKNYIEKLKNMNKKTQNKQMNKKSKKSIFFIENL